MEVLIWGYDLKKKNKLNSPNILRWEPLVWPGGLAQDEIPIP